MMSRKKLKKEYLNKGTEFSNKLASRWIKKNVSKNDNLICIILEFIFIDQHITHFV